MFSFMHKKYVLAPIANGFLAQCAVVYISGEGGQGQLDGFFYGIVWYFVYMVFCI